MCVRGALSLFRSFNCLFEDSYLHALDDLQVVSLHIILADYGQPSARIHPIGFDKTAHRAAFILTLPNPKHPQKLEVPLAV